MCVFTLPSALALVTFAYGVSLFGSALGSGWLHGLKVAAVAVVALAILGMARTLTPDRERASVAALAAVTALVIDSVCGQIGVIVVGAIAGMTVLKRERAPADHPGAPVPTGRTVAIFALAAFAVLLAGLPVVSAVSGNADLQLFDTFFRTGSLVFGGGHVVLPLLQAQVVPPGWVSNDAFLAGYGAAQAVPGPLFTFSAYLGAAIGGWKTAALCLVAIFLPSFLLVIGVMPFWDGLRRRTATRATLRGINAAVVGLLLAAFYNPVWTSGILSKADFGLAVVAFVLLLVWRTPPWLVVVGCSVCASCRRRCEFAAGRLRRDPHAKPACELLRKLPGNATGTRAARGRPFQRLPFQFSIVEPDAEVGAISAHHREIVILATLMKAEPKAEAVG